MNLKFLIPLLLSCLFFSCQNDDDNKNINVIDPDLLPTVETVEVTEITNSKATSGGRVIFSGGSSIVSKGICWSTEKNPRITDNSFENGNGAEAFISQMDSLIPETRYYIRAYARNSYGLVYGEEITFETLGRPVDADGNEYNTVIISNQEWFTENLKTTKYINGDSMDEKYSHVSWRNTNSGAYVENFIFADDSSKERFGLLYNFWSIENERGLCPVGWHVSTKQDWLTLFENLGNDYSEIGALLKEKGTNNWVNPNNGVDTVGFSARGGGYRIHNASPVLPNGFDHYTLYAYFWVNTLDSISNQPILFRMKNDKAEIEELTLSKISGASVRCVKD